jgi:F-type H+-transporting ATPase subunit gamma
MDETPERLTHQIAVAGELHSVVRTMKALAAANIGQYEQAVRSLQEYDGSVQLGLAECIRELPGFAGASVGSGGSVGSAASAASAVGSPRGGSCGLVIFGSDQGLVGQFNTMLLEFVRRRLPSLAERKSCWLIGERLYSEWEIPEIQVNGHYTVPLAVSGITPLIRDLLRGIDRQRVSGAAGDVYVVHQRPVGQSRYEPVMQQLLPLSGAWAEALSTLRWPGGRRPELIGGAALNGPRLIREYLFVSFYKACAESLASENAARLAAMQHAEKNIDEMQDQLIHTYQRLRQEAIDEELFDVVFGSEALQKGSG